MKASKASPYCRLFQAATERHQQRVFRIQDSLYNRALSDSKFRLYTGSLILDLDFMLVSWEQRRKANGAPGLDRKSIQMVEQMGVERFLRHLRREVRNGHYQAQPYALDLMNRGPNKVPRELRRGVVADKILQGSAELVYGPVLMADILPCCYGVLGKGAPPASKAIGRAMERAKYMVWGDINDYYKNIIIAWLMSDIRKRTADNRLLDLIMQWLSTSTVDERNKRIILPGDRGIPQGAVTSPLWSAYYLSLRFDQPFHENGWDKEFGATLTRYADNIYVTCQRKPEELAARMELLLNRHELRCPMRVDRVTEPIPVLGFLMQKTPAGVQSRIMPGKEDKLQESIRKSYRQWMKEQGHRITGWENFYGQQVRLHEPGYLRAVLDGEA